MLIKILEENKNKNPEKIILQDENHSINFEDFVIMAKKIGSEIAKLGYKNRAIAVEADRSIYSMIGFYAALYSGNFFMPVDSTTPAERLNSMVKQSQPISYLAVNKDGVFKNFNPIIIKDGINFKIDEEILNEIQNKYIDIDPCYMIWTSGSTGEPKGVLIKHNQAKELAIYLKEILEIEEDDIIGNQSPFYFDGAMKEVFLFGYYGVKLVIIPRKYFSLPKDLVSFLNQHRVNVLLWAVSALNILINSKILEKENLKYVNKITFAGESFQTSKLNYLRNKLNASFTNLYGPSETTVDATYYKIERYFKNDEMIPIGKAFPNMEVFLIDEDLNQVYDKGEIVIRGAKVSSGYYNDKKRTDEVFIQDPRQNFYKDIVYRTGDIGQYDEDGNIVFLSRIDDQIKHMGNRIELGEIDAQISAMKEVFEGACIYDEEKSLIIYYYSGDKIARRDVFVFLRERLPKYMFPNKVVQLDKIPKNATGKIDRLKLKEIYEESRS